MQRLGGDRCVFLDEIRDETRTVAETPSALLSVQEAKTGITARLQQETKEVRAGQNFTYILSVENTGELPLENIEISSVFLRII